MKTVKYYELCDELERVNREVTKGMGNSRRICLRDMTGIHRMPIKIGVDWAAIGTVDADEASTFSGILQKASDAARVFKYNGFMIDFSE